MRYIEWIVMFIVAGLGIALANFVGFQVGFADSLPGIAVLLLISLAAVVLVNFCLLSFRWLLIVLFLDFCWPVLCLLSGTLLLKQQERLILLRPLPW